jgi:CubicO group peptidase (beta-lactamase class C family)
MDESSLGTAPYARFSLPCHVMIEHFRRSLRIPAVLIGLSSVGQAQAASSARPLTPSDDWPTAKPTDVGLNPEALRAHELLCQRSAADACVVVYRGAIVQEWYGPAYKEPMYAMSSTKSIAGLLAGQLIADGKLTLDDPVSRFVPQWRAGSVAGVTVRHLLSMTSGLPNDQGGGPNVGFVSDKDSLVFTLPVANAPGSSWAYSNNGAHMLSPLMRTAAGEPLERYAQRRLFEPLGMTRSKLHVYPDGQAWTHADMETTPRDLARIGQMMLSGGRWKGKQVVAGSWVTASTQPSQTLNPKYGLMWWLDVPGGYAARGYLDTHIYVLPQLELVVVRMQSKPATGATPYEREASTLWPRIVGR